MIQHLICYIHLSTTCGLIYDEGTSAWLGDDHHQPGWVSLFPRWRCRHVWRARTSISGSGMDLEKWRWSWSRAWTTLFVIYVDQLINNINSIVLLFYIVVLESKSEISLYEHIPALFLGVKLAIDDLKNLNYCSKNVKIPFVWFFQMFECCKYSIIILAEIVSSIWFG